MLILPHITVKPEADKADEAASPTKLKHEANEAASNNMFKSEADAMHMSEGYNIVWNVWKIKGSPFCTFKSILKNF